MRDEIQRLGALVIRLNHSRWYRGFWLVWFAGFGIYDLIVGLWPFALGQATAMILIVILWMFIDRRRGEY